MECPHCHIYVGSQNDKCPNCNARLAGGAPTQEALWSREPTIHAPFPFSSADPQARTSHHSDEETLFAPGESEKQTGNRYEIISEIGKGAAGVVWLAKDKNVFDRKVAIKRIGLDRLNPGNASSTSRQDLLTHFMAEPRAQAGVRHSNVVHIYDCGVDEEGVFIVMEYVSGGSLQQKMDARSPMEPRTVIPMAIQLCDALSEVHRRGMVHRDIKPRNILLTERGTPKLSDFGLVLEFKGADSQASGTFLGTMAYMSPEQRIDSSSVDAVSDIYSLGATLYECLTGESPEHYQPEKLPSSVREAVARAMEENPTNRYEDADAFKRALERQLSDTSAGKEGTEYPCYECYKPVPYTSLYCPNCGKKLSAMREAIEEQYAGALDQSVASVEAGAFDRAAKTLEHACALLGHAHFSHFLKKVKEQLAWVGEEEMKAVTRKKGFEEKLEKARRHLDAGEIEHALRAAASVAREQAPYYASVTEQAATIKSRCESVLEKRKTLHQKIDRAVTLANENNYEEAFDLLDRVVAEHDIGFEKVRREGAQTKDRLAEQRLSEMTAAAREEISAARHAMEMGHIDTALEAAKKICDTDEPFLQQQREEARDLIDQYHAVAEEKEQLAACFQKAKDFAGEKQYGDAIRQIERITQKGGAAFAGERNAAAKLKALYERSERDQIRSGVQASLEAAKKARWLFKKSLLRILCMQGDFLKDLRADAYRLLRRKTWSSVINSVLRYLALAAVGVGIMIWPDYSLWGEDLWVIAAEVNVRPAPNKGSPPFPRLYRGERVQARRIAKSSKISPWVYVRSTDSPREGYVWANTLSSRRGGKPLFKKGVITRDTALITYRPWEGIRLDGRPRIESGTKVEFVDQCLGTYQRGNKPIAAVWYQVRSPQYNGWVDFHHVRMNPQGYPDAVEAYVRWIPLVLVLGLVLMIWRIYKNVLFLKSIKSMRPQVTPGPG